MDDSYRILADGEAVSNDTRRTGLNNNDAIIGPSGAGKTRGYVMPNILQCNGSLIVTDTKGMLYSEMRDALAQAGYKVQCIDLADCARSPCGYNPLDYIGEMDGRPCTQDIMALAACLVTVETHNDPYWELAARMYLESLIGYVLECLPRDEWHFGSIRRLMPELGARGCYGRLIDELEVLDPDSFAVSRYRLVQSVAEGADRTNACTQGFLASKLSMLVTDSVEALARSPDRVRFEDIGRHRTAVFLTISDTDDSLYRLANVFYAQALHALCNSADRDYADHRLAVPVRLILDDFASNTSIPDFDKITSVIRSRNISVSIILQSLSQLEAMYGPARAATILNNCDSCLYLGGQDVGTAKHIAVKANKPTSAILAMPLDSAWLFRRGSAPRMVKKYDVTKHERYRLLPEARREKAQPMAYQAGYDRL